MDKISSTETFLSVGNEDFSSELPTVTTEGF
jgi:hypothetical protein